MPGKRYYGKILGALLGFALLRHPLGLLLGAVLGHALDSGWLRRSHSKPGAPADDSLDAAYALFELPSQATEAELDRAYRRLMAKYHPDRVAGAADEIRALAEERARAINAAYDRIRDARRGRAR